MLVLSIFPSFFFRIKKLDNRLFNSSDKVTGINNFLDKYNQWNATLTSWQYLTQKVMHIFDLNWISINNI